METLDQQYGETGGDIEVFFAGEDFALPAGVTNNGGPKTLGYYKLAGRVHPFGSLRVAPNFDYTANGHVQLPYPADSDGQFTPAIDAPGSPPDTWDYIESQNIALVGYIEVETGLKGIVGGCPVLGGYGIFPDWDFTRNWDATKTHAFVLSATTEYLHS